MKRSGLIAMIVLTVLPLVTTGLAVLFVLPDVIPLHAGAGGARLGSTLAACGIPPFLVGFGALATVAYAYMDRLAARYGSDAHSGRVLLLFALALMNVWQLIFLIWMTFSAT